MSVDVALDNIRIRQFDADFGLDDLRIRELAPINVGITSLPAISVGLTQLPDINLNAGLTVHELPTIRLDTESDLRTDSTVKTDSEVRTESKIDLALDLRVRELPRIDLQLGFRPMRFHFPMNYRFCLTLFGCKVFEFTSCGEAMVVAEDYVPRQTEGCD
ncbi:hypothetical protein RE428_14240 [Marinobacter nanhaiticus D15-8W]|uniref:Uncharacterized protein n=1 Tax=Marinobacter nanhaiticus D15-8W TaxID=626887 RepID=N6WNF1_9GAMM|nr:hypothetical protein [Marinobacter nanhaiticus]ENO13051.1 hypothetical protein J057_16675 [Marinobacter nanhaiticus D15-8W]BES70406.1 hypothetical protein RE428_14240 [Marinobacter nanhaiticus D15-8W]